MSSIPKHTKILIKDLDFQAKYNLSHTQTDLMAYMVNVPYWADSVDGYFVITTSKILSDLPHLGLKNFEPAFKALKDLGLIESKIVKVTHWTGKPKLRAIKLTKKGKEYESNMILPSQDEKVKRLEKEKQELQETIDRLMIEKEESNKNSEKETEPKPISKLPKKDEIAEFIQKNIKYFGATSRPICNFVPNYQKETTFYINSYGKLSTVTQDNEAKQIFNPKTVYEFWQWLYLNPQRVGDEIDFSTTPTPKELKQRFINRTIKLKELVCTISDFVESEDGIKVEIKEEDGAKRFLLNAETKEAMVFEPEYCQKVILEVLYNKR